MTSETPERIWLIYDAEADENITWSDRPNPYAEYGEAPDASVEYVRADTRPPVPDKQLTDVVEDAEFLCARLRDLEGSIGDAEQMADDYLGHVSPALARLESTLASLSTAPTGDDVERLRDLLDTERYKVAIGVQAIARAVQGRQWLSQPGRGSYTYDDDRYQQEFGSALSEIEAALKPLQAIAQDWSDCPRDPLRVAANRSAALKATTHTDRSRSQTIGEG